MNINTKIIGCSEFEAYLSWLPNESVLAIYWFYIIINYIYDVVVMIHTINMLILPEVTQKIYSYNQYNAYDLTQTCEMC